MGDAEALGQLAAELPQPLALRQGLHSFGDGLVAEGGGQA
jgi:hypothetical protein